MIHISHRYELFFFMLSLPFSLLVLSNHYRHYGICSQKCQSFFFWIFVLFISTTSSSYLRSSIIFLPLLSYSAAPPFRNMLSLLKSNDDIFPLPQTSPSASTPKTPPYTGYPVQTVSHIAWHLPVLPSHPPTPWLLPITHGY